MNTYLIAETAFHHEGDKSYLLRLIDAAFEAGADAVKFQILINLNDFMSSNHSAYNEALDWTLSENDWKEVLKYTLNKGLDVVAMPLDVSAFDLIEQFDIRYIEVHSVSFHDDELLECLDDTDIDLIFGVGGRTKEEIASVVSRYAKRKIILMAGFQSYPTEFVDSRINKVSALHKTYPHCVIGYTDHSSYDDSMAIKSSELAYAYGARVFEKHLTIEEGVKRVDYQSAISIEKFSEIRDNLHQLSSATQGVDVYSLSAKELNYRNRQKVPVAAKNIFKGEKITSNDIKLKMIDAENIIDKKKDILNKLAAKDISVDNAFYLGDLV